MVTFVIAFFSAVIACLAAAELLLSEEEKGRFANGISVARTRMENLRRKPSERLAAAEPMVLIKASVASLVLFVISVLLFVLLVRAFGLSERWVQPFAMLGTAMMLIILGCFYVLIGDFLAYVAIAVLTFAESILRRIAAAPKPILAVSLLISILIAFLKVVGS